MTFASEQTHGLSIRNQPTYVGPALDRYGSIPEEYSTTSSILFPLRSDKIFEDCTLRPHNTEGLRLLRPSPTTNRLHIISKSPFSLKDILIKRPLLPELMMILKFLWTWLDGPTRRRGKHFSSYLAIDELCKALEQNTIQELSLSFHKNEILGLNSKSRLARKKSEKLFAALRKNTSLKKVSLGPQGGCQNSSTMDKLLTAMAEIPSLDTLQLCLQAWVDEGDISEILSRFKYLRALQISQTRILSDTINIDEPLGHNNEFNWSLKKESSLIQELAPHLERLKVLKLSDCGIGDEDLTALQRHMEENNFCLDELSFKGNKKITDAGLEAICYMKTRRLDLTNCRVSISGLQTMIDALEHDDSFYLQELVLPWNSPTTNKQGMVPALVRAFLGRTLLDIGCCTINAEDMGSIFQLLEKEECKLESFTLNGYCTLPSGAVLKRTLETNKTLKHLSLQHEGHISRKIVHDIREGLEWNYTLETLTIHDLAHRQAPPASFDSTIRMLLELNRAGRGKLFQKNPRYVEDWVQIMSKVSSQPDCINWLLQNGGAELFLRR